MRSERLLRDAIALGLIMTFVCPQRGDTKEIHIAEVPSTITAVLGQNLTIPCYLTNDSIQDLGSNPSTVGVRWSKKFKDGSEGDVYKFSDNKHEPIRPESSIDQRELNRGDASLTLQHAQRSDEGEYICTVIVTPYKASANIHVQLLAQPHVTLSTTKLIVKPELEKSVICEVSKFYPERVKIRWAKYSQSSGTRFFFDRATYRTDPEENSDGTFNVTSQLTVTPSSIEENKDVYFCVVTHESFSDDKDANFTLIVEGLTFNLLYNTWINSFLGLVIVIACIAGWSKIVKVSPKISHIAGVEDLVHMKRSILAFMVSGFRPDNIEIHLYLRRSGGTEKQKITSWKYPSPQRVKYCNDQVRGERVEPMCNQSDSFLESEIQPLKLVRSFILNSCLCSTHITLHKETDEGAELIIEVIQEAKKSAIIVCQKLKISEAEPVGKPIPCKNAVQEAGR